MAGRRSSRDSGQGPARDEARREQERLERARRRAEREAADTGKREAQEARRRPPASERSWTDDEWSDADWTPAGAGASTGEYEAYAAPATRAGQDRQRTFAPLAPAPPRGRRGADDDDPNQPRAERSRPRRTRPRRAGRVAGIVSGVDLSGSLASVGAFVSARRVAVGGGVVAVLVLIGIVTLVGGGAAKQTPAQVAAAKEAAARKVAEAKWAKSPYGKPTDVQLPPKTRIVAYAGAPHAKALGILGNVSFKTAAAKLKAQSAPYARPTRHVLRAYDLIATVASAAPGPSGKYRTRQPPSVIARYLRAARRDHAALILDVQPGQSSFPDEIKPLARWLKEPDVQLALDPEWRMQPGVVPGTEIGYVNGPELNTTLAQVESIIKADHLPPKMVLVHRFTAGMIKDFGAVTVPKDIVGVISIDGVGAKANKIATYNRIAPTLPKPWLPGFKLFYQEDQKAGGIMSGKQVMALKPRPHVILYE